MLLMLAMCCGCVPGASVARKTKTRSDYVATVRSAKAVLPIAVEMEELFPVADHFITHYGFNDGPRVWNTEVFFGGRYTLTMQVDVEIDYSANKITKVGGEPKFSLTETRKVDILPDGRAQSWYNGQNQRRFGPAEWEKVYQTKGDFSALDVTINHDPVPNFEEDVSQARRDRVPVSLLDE
jgi:hypothetical protein